MTETKIPMQIFTSYEALTQYYGDRDDCELGLYVSDNELLVGHAPTAYSFNPQYFTGYNELLPDYAPPSVIDYTVNAESNNSTYGYVTGAGTFPQHSEITLNAYAYNGYKFDKWSNDVETAAYTFAVEENVDLTAIFVDNTYTVTTRPSVPSCTTTGDGVYIAGTSVTVTATPAEGYYFTNQWFDEDTKKYVSTDAEYTFTVEKNTNLMALFATYFTVSATPNNVSYGSTTGSGNQYKYNDSATVTATAETGYRFVNWTEDNVEVSTSSSYTFNVTGNRTLVANFEPATANINISANNPTYGSVDAAGSTVIGDNYTVMAEANTGYMFVNWTENGNEVSTSANYTFTVTGDRTLVANFVQAITITTSTSTGHGTVSAGGTFPSGSSYTLVSTPDSGYRVGRILKDGLPVLTPSTSITYNNITSDTTFVVEFEEITYQIYTSANPTAGGTTTGDGAYTPKAQATITATPNAGYEFQKWQYRYAIGYSWQDISTSATYTFTVNGKGYYQAVFKASPFYVENITNANETLSIVKTADAAPTITVEYSSDNTNWNTLGTTSTTAITRTLTPGEKLYLRANTNAWYGSSAANKILGISKVGGNIMSLLYGSNFAIKTTFPNSSESNFRELFKPNDTSVLMHTSSLLLPATTLTNYCYRSMFESCSQLMNAPALPALTLATGCYSNMFNGAGSEHLTTIPELPAPALIDNCYDKMFYYGPKPTYVKCLATTNITASNCTRQWLNNAPATGTFVKAAGTTWTTGESGIPAGWTVVEEAV